MGQTCTNCNYYSRQDETPNELITLKQNPDKLYSFKEDLGPQMMNLSNTNNEKTG